MSRPIKKGSTDQSIVIFIMDSTDGTPETAVEHNTAGIDLWYRREGATKTSITEAALAALDSAHADGGIEAIANGEYRLDLPDAACAAGANGVQIGGTITDMIVVGPYIPLVSYDPYDTVRLGLTALPNAAADAAGGLPISDAGGLDLDTQIGTDIDAILVDTAVIGALGAGLSNIPWNASWDAEVQSECADALTVYDPPTKTEMDTGHGLLATEAKQDIIDTTCDSVLVDTAVIGALGAGLTALPWNASWDTQVESEVADALAVYDPPTKAEMDTAHALLATVAKQDVIDGIVDSILVDTAAVDAKLPSKGYLRGTADADGGMDTEDKADVNTQVDSALDTAVPGAPTANSINERVVAVDNKLPSKAYLSGSTDADGGIDSVEQAVITALQAASFATYGTAKGIKKNTALLNFTFPMLDSAGDPVTGITPTGTRNLDGGAAISTDGTITEIALGKYQFDAAAADTNGDDVLWTFSGTGAEDTIVRFRTV